MAKVILVSDNWQHIRKVQEFAQKEGFEFSYSSEKEWKGFKGDNSLPVVMDSNVLPVGIHPVISMQEVEYRNIKKVLTHLGGNIHKTAKALNISRSSLYRRIKHLGISLKEIKSMRGINENNVIHLKDASSNPNKKVA